MLIQLYIADGTIQCEPRPPSDPADGKAKLEECGLLVYEWTRLRRPGQLPSMCGIPTGWCWIYEVDAPTRQSLLLASQADFRVWSFDQDGLERLLELTGGGVDVWPWKRVPALLGVDILPWQTAAESGGVDAWPWRKLVERIDAATLRKAGDNAGDDPLILFDDPPPTAASLCVSDIVGMKLRVFAPGQDIGDDSFDMGRINLKTDEAHKITAAWIG